MRRGYRRRKRGTIRRILAVIFVPMIVFSLALLWIWKANKVKEYYAEVRRLQTEKVGMIAENSRLKGQLMDLKSISAIDKVVTEQFGLTQNVARRITLTDPVAAEPKKETKLNFASDEIDLLDRVEEAVVTQGKALADPKKPIPKGMK